jgi:hypothetical protein
MKITYLYAKQHNVTGFRYFGKTTKDPYKYCGSGLHWKRHLKKHGNDVTTTWVMAYTDKETLVKEALFFSAVYDIVISNEWANAKPENGLDGWPPGTPNPRSVPQSEETKSKRKATLKGSHKSAKFGAENGNYGKPMPEERKQKMRATKAANPTAVPWTAERRDKVAATWAKKKEQNVKF